MVGNGWWVEGGRGGTGGGWQVAVRGWTLVSGGMGEGWWVAGDPICSLIQKLQLLFNHSILQKFATKSFKHQQNNT